MYRHGHIVVTLIAGETLPHVPNHLDCLVGAGRATGRLDGGPIERAIVRWAGGCRCTGVFHARRSLGRIGEQHVGFDDLEERLGLSRTYQIELATPERTRAVVGALRDLAQIETAVEQTLATVPFAVAPPVRSAIHRLTRDDAERPHHRVRAAEALAMEPGIEGVTVGIVDSGVALGHEELQRKLLAGFDTVDLGLGEVGDGLRLVGDSRGTDFSPRDDAGHGCHVAGVIGAQGWRIPPGIAGHCLLLPIRVLAGAEIGQTGRRTGVGALPDIDAGLKVCVDLGADVINMSFGTPASLVDPAGPPPHQAVVRYADLQGCVLVAAAGNSGKRQRFYPSALPEVLAVGSLGEDNRRSSFSTWGDHLALCAPGERIVSLGRHGYKVSTGTSHAAPFVAGAAALLVSRARRRGARLRGEDVRSLLVRSATPLAPTGFDPEVGYGLLNAAAALEHLDRAWAAGESLGRST
jgi:subtilisin family serine protease